MKKIYAVSLAMMALVIASCNKESNIEIPVEESAVKTFVVQAPQSTKTTVDGVEVKWAAGDKIRVFGYTDSETKGEATFVLKSGAGSSTAVFELEDGQSLATYDNYYAIYPSSVPSAYSASDGITVTSGLNVTAQAAVENGFDPAFAIMTAKADGEGKLAFRHGASYFKVTIPDDGITKVELTFGKNAAQKRPFYNADDGSIRANNGGAAVIAATGSFVKGSSYYIAAIPNTANKMVSLKLAMTKGGAENSLTSTNSKLDAKITLGEVYNLGTPAISFDPSISPDTPSKLEADATAGSFTYSVLNPDGVSVVSAVKKSGDWITSVDDSVEGTISFTCTANTGDERTGVITLSYPGADDVDVTVTQKAVGAGIEEHEYIFCLNGSGTVTQTADGASGSFFTVTGSSKLACSASGYFGVTGYEIAGNTYTYAKKIDGSNNVSFTTRAGYTTTARFYAASRNTNTTATMNFITGSTKVKILSLTWTDNKADLIDSGVIALEQGTTYTFSKSGEVGVFYIVVNETEE